MIHLASDPSRCLTLAPTSTELDVDQICSNVKVKGGVLHNSILREAYKLPEMGRICSEFLQTLGRWRGTQFKDFSNLVTTQDCFPNGVVSSSNSIENARMHSLEKEQGHFIINNNSGLFYNLESGSCVQMGGAIDKQCYYEGNLVTNPYIRANPYPAYLFPCDRSCNEIIQRWTLVPIAGTENVNTNTFQIRIANNNKEESSICLHNGIDATSTYWYNNAEPITACVLTTVILLAALVYEACYSRATHNWWTNKQISIISWQDRHVFTQGFWWWSVRVLLSVVSAGASIYFASALLLPLHLGGRGYYPRQVVVHWNLFFIACVFVHMMLIARKGENSSERSAREWNTVVIVIVIFIS